MQLKKTYLLLFAICSLCSCPQSQANDGAYEQCYVINVQNKEAGYSCISQNTEKQNDTTFVITKKHTEEEFNNFNLNVNLVSDITYQEDLSGKPVSIKAVINNFNEKTEYKITFSSDQTATLTITKNDETKTEQISSDERILLPYAIRQLLKNRITQNVAYSTLDEKNDFRLSKIKAQKLNTEAISINNQSKNLLKYKFFVDSIPNIENDEWVDDDGYVQKLLFSVFDLEQTATDKEKISGLNDTQSDFYKKIFTTNASLGSIKDIDQITYKIVLPQNINSKDIVVNDDRQRIIQEKNNVVYLKVRNDDALIPKKYSTALLSTFLKSNNYINSQSEAIKQTAQKIILSEKNSTIIAKKLTKWVSSNIANASYKVNFSPSEATLKNMKGDPTEKALLLAALLRSAHIPSKIVIGMTYSDAPKNAFMYDVWVKAYVGEWINLNPVRTEETFKPTHIALYESDFNSNKDKSRFIVNTLNNITAFKVDVLNYNVADSNIKQLKTSQNQQYDQTNLLSLLKSNTDIIKKISLSSANTSQDAATTLQLRARTQTEYFDIGLYNFARADISSALDNFNKASLLIPYNDNFEDVGFAYKMASLGLFSKAQTQVHNVADSKIWGTHIQFMKQLYFPSKMPSEGTEMLLAKANALASYADSPDDALSLLNKNQYVFKETDYAYYVKAKADCAKKNYPQAINDIEKAIKLSPKTVNYQRERINILIEAKQYKKAEKYLNQLKKNPSINNKFKRLLDEKFYFIKAQTEKKNRNINYYLAKLNFIKEDYKKAEALLEESNADGRENALLGDIYYNSDEIAKAQMFYERALKKNSNNPDALYGHGNTDLSQRKYDEALSYYQKALKNAPNSDQIMVSIADTYKSLTKEDQAYDFYAKAVDQNPQNADALYNMAIIDANNGEKAKSHNELILLLSYNPVYTPAWLELAKEAIEKENTFVASVYLKPIDRLSPNNYRYYFYQGLIDKINSDYSNARSNFKKVLSLNPDFTEAQKELDELN